MNNRKTLIEAYREHPYRNIFTALVAVILVDALAPISVARGLLSNLMLAAILVVALAETVRSRRNAVWAIVFGAPAIIARLVIAFRPDATLQNTAALVLSAFFLLFLVWNLLHDLVKRARPTSERIFGALCAYVFIGLLFSLVYAHMEYRRPGAFSISNRDIAATSSEEASLVPVFTYYSFVTLTTLGYGDITPVAEYARTLAWLEALLGQLYLAVMVAGFVAIHVSEGMKENRKPPPGG